MTILFVNPNSYSKWHPLRAGLSAISSIEGYASNPMMRKREWCFFLTVAGDRYSQLCFYFLTE
jgi:hypothetical protein